MVVFCRTKSIFWVLNVSTGSTRFDLGMIRCDVSCAIWIQWSQLGLHCKGQDSNSRVLETARMLNLARLLTNQTTDRIWKNSDSTTPRYRRCMKAPNLPTRIGGSLKLSFLVTACSDTRAGCQPRVVTMLVYGVDVNLL